MLEYLYDAVIIHMLVFARIGGILFFNPLFGRSNVPSQWRTAFVLVLTMIVAPTLNTSDVVFETDFSMFFALANELMFGFALNSVFIMFYYMIFFAGDLLDFNFGLSMAKVFDPGTNIQMSLTGNLFTILFSIYFFAVDCHLLFIRIITASFTLIQVGVVIVPSNFSQFMLEVFYLSMLILARLIAPFLVLQFIMEMSMGVLMKLIPQIHVFVLNIQLKILIGLTILITVFPNIMDIMDEYTQRMFWALQELMTLF